MAGALRLYKSAKVRDVDSSITTELLCEYDLKAKVPNFPQNSDNLKHLHTIKTGKVTQVQLFSSSCVLLNIVQTTDKFSVPFI